MKLLTFDLFEKVQPDWFNKNPKFYLSKSVKELKKRKEDNIENEIRGYVFSLLLTYLILFVLVYVKRKKIKIPLVIILSIILVDNHLTNIFFLFVCYILFVAYIFINKKKEYYRLILYSLIAFPILGLLAYKGNPINAIQYFIKLITGKGAPGWVFEKENFWFPLEYLFKKVINLILAIFGIFGSIYIIFGSDNIERKRIIVLISFLIIFLLPICLSQVPNGYRFFFIILPIWALLLSYGFYYIIYSYARKITLKKILFFVFLNK